MASGFQGLTTAEALHYALCSRELAAGHGFTTPVLMPAGLNITPDLFPHPEIWRAPLFIIFESVWFRIMGVSMRLAAAASGMSWLLCVWSVWWLAAKLFDRKFATLAAGFMLIHIPLLNLSISGLPNLLTAALMTLLVWSWCEATSLRMPSDIDPGLSVYKFCVLNGVLSGLLMLCDYTMVWPVLIIGVTYWGTWAANAMLNNELQTMGSTRTVYDLPKAWVTQRMAPRLVALFGVAILLVTLPWMVRNARVTGSPFGSLHAYETLTQTVSFPGHSAFRTYAPGQPTPAEHVAQYPLQHLRKLTRGLGQLPEALSEATHPIFFALFLMACMIPARRNDRYDIRRLLVFIGLYGVSLSWTSQNMDKLSAFAPAILVFGLGSLPTWLDHFGQKSRLDQYGRRPNKFIRAIRQRKTGLIYLSLALLLAAGIASRPHRILNNPALQPSLNIKFLSEQTGPDELVMSVSPWVLAWHGDVHAIWMAQDVASMNHLTQKLGPKLPWIYFPRQRTLIPNDEVPRWWIETIQSPLGFGPYRPYSSQSRNERLLHRISVETAP